MKNFKDYFKDSELDFLKEVGEETTEANKNATEEESFFMISSIYLQSLVVIADKLSTFMKASMDGINSTNELNTSMESVKDVISHHYNITNKINKAFADATEICQKRKFFWRYSPIEVYKDNLERLKANYLAKIKDSTELDFLKFEYKYTYSDDNNEVNFNYKTIIPIDYLSVVNFKRYLTAENLEVLSMIRLKKLEFLNGLLKNIGYSIEFSDEGKEEIEIVETGSLEESKLNLSNLPKFNVQQRYQLFKRLGYDKAIDILDTDKQMAKYSIIALIMGINPDNAKQLYNNSYRQISDKDENSLKEYLNNQGIRIK